MILYGSIYILTIDSLFGFQLNGGQIATGGGGLTCFPACYTIVGECSTVITAAVCASL